MVRQPHKHTHTAACLWLTAGQNVNIQPMAGPGEKAWGVHGRAAHISISVLLRQNINLLYSPLLFGAKQGSYTHNMQFWLFSYFVIIFESQIKKLVFSIRKCVFSTSNNHKMSSKSIKSSRILSKRYIAPCILQHLG